MILTQNLLPVFQYIDEHKADYVHELIRICEVPAPMFQEQERAAYFALRFKALGLDPVIDEVGNVEIPFCRNGGLHVVLSAHLDTVFPFETITVKRDGSMLRAPGIADDSAGLAALMLLCRAFRETQTLQRGSLILLATVGEEGLGNLRGARHFFSRHRDVDYFLSLDGSDAERVVTTGLGSKRLRIFLRGPGGHSWSDAGIPNPIHVAGELLSKIKHLSLSGKPKTTINVGVIGGGTSINAIPTEMFCDVDLRSESAESLARLDEFVRQSLEALTKTEKSIRSEMQILGERPSGSIAVEHPLVRKAMAANQQFGLDTKLDSGSTDSNIPFALGIPAITLGVGGRSGKIHTPEEWYDVTDAERGLKRTALLLAKLLHS